jgi:hypothetical protein
LDLFKVKIEIEKFAIFREGIEGESFRNRE